MDLEHERRLAEVEQRAKSNQHRLAEVEKRQDDLDKLVSAVNVLALREERVEKNVEEIKVDVKNLTAKPGRRWESLVNQLITLAVAAAVGFLLAKIGL